MLHFFPPGMAERYLLFCFLIVCGALQMVAAHYRLAGLLIPGRRHWKWGYGLGAGLIGGGYLWFFGRLQPLIFQPGLAGFELFTVFATGGLLALMFTLSLVSGLHPLPRPSRVQGEPVTFDPGHGVLMRPDDPDSLPAVVIISGLPTEQFPLDRLARRLVARGMVTVVLDLVTDGEVRYPEILARVPATLKYLQKQPGIQRDRIAVIGAGIGGDVALRVAATNSTISAVVAIDPMLDRDVTGIAMMEDLTYWQALRWGRLHQHLVAALAVSQRLDQLEGRPVLLLGRSNLILGTAPTSVEGMSFHSDSQAIMQVVDWLVRTLPEVATLVT